MINKKFVLRAILILITMTLILSSFGPALAMTDKTKGELSTETPVTQGRDHITDSYASDVSNMPLTRAIMAVMLLKGMHGASYTPPAVGGGTGFGDVATDYWAAAWIKQLFAEGIISGCGSGNYCPDAFVYRSQIPIFILRAENGTSYYPPPAGADTGFTDVPTSYWSADWIKEFAVQGIANECGANLYCPDEPTTIAETLDFVLTVFGLQLFVISGNDGINGTTISVPFASLFQIQDPSFEANPPNPYWTEFSTNFGTPLCTVGDCTNGGGSALPRTGYVWGWFGGTSTNETAILSQSIIIPSGFPNLKLQFYFWIGAAQAGSDAGDVFNVKVDNVTVFSANATQQGSYPIYTPILVNLSTFADDTAHTISFSSVTTGQGVNFNLDDVTVVDVPFLDVPSDYWAGSFIGRLYDAGITGGCGTGIYCPDSTVTRAQMAVFLLKGIHGSSYTPPAINGNTGFGDVATDYWAAAWIKQLAAEGITSGCGAGIYCPDATVTRAQMAVFLLKAKNGSGFTPPAVGVSTGFNDVAANYWAAPFIKQLVADGITSGCGGGNYCPDSDVTRAQMAVFLVKTFNLP
ncbi:MAG: S-layer homology domain-containing protein [Anaerolineales bacterium]|nr:S-layer homology domain-containing protein [Anaerolineales bacterium]